MNNEHTHIYSAEKSSNLESRWRSILQNPDKILSPFIKKDMTVVDLGCGPGFFTIPIRSLTGKNGKIIAIDVQEEMLEILQRKISTLAVTNIEMINSSYQPFDSVNTVDFILAAYVIHELRNKKEWIQKLYTSLKNGGQLLIIEPSIVVSKKDFKQTKELVLATGFELIKKPRVLFSKAILVRKGYNGD